MEAGRSLIIGPPLTENEYRLTCFTHLRANSYHSTDTPLLPPGPSRHKGKLARATNEGAPLVFGSRVMATSSLEPSSGGTLHSGHLPRFQSIVGSAELGLGQRYTRLGSRCRPQTRRPTGTLHSQLHWAFLVELNRILVQGHLRRRSAAPLPGLLARLRCARCLLRYGRSLMR
jgi:hypothetical protein